MTEQKIDCELCGGDGVLFILEDRLQSAHESLWRLKKDDPLRETSQGIYCPCCESQRDLQARCGRRVNRVELIDHRSEPSTDDNYGRVFASGIDDDLKVEVQFQDQLRTMKIFVTSRSKGEK